ncbi:MAG: hypothetical protein AAF394_10580 [Planctomycetota bacterium]
MLSKSEKGMHCACCPRTPGDDGESDVLICEMVREKSQFVEEVFERDTEN